MTDPASPPSSILNPGSSPAPGPDEVAQRLLTASLGTIDVLAVYLGDRLGWYRSLRDDGPATAAELAQRTATAPRYAREWLEQQAMTGLLQVEAGFLPEESGNDGGTANDGGKSRRYILPPGAAEVLTAQHSLNYLAPLARMLAAAAVEMPALLTAYRTGGGVGWSRFGADARESQADMNRPWFQQELPAALAAVPQLDALLRRPGARIADIGCGAGWSTISLARAYPAAAVEGFDLDDPSIELARTNAKDARAGDRVSFHLADAGGIPEATYDVVFAFECIHDMPGPVDVLAAARRALLPGGVVVVMDEAVAETFNPPGDELERLMYGFSLLISLPDGMAHPETAATGTVLRPATLRGYAEAAGFADMQVLPIENFGFWRFYQLTPTGNLQV